MKPYLLIFILAALAGCTSEPIPLTEPPQLDPATGKPDFWLAKPGAASVYSDDYDKLWGVCTRVAVGDFFEVDRQDYRDGVLTTYPMVSKQIWEFWRHDAGDTYYAMEDTLQAVRRTVRFEFDRSGGGSGATVTPKVLIERFVQPNKRITSTGEYRQYFSPPGARERTADYWYAIGRDYELESTLALSIRKELAQ